MENTKPSITDGSPEGHNTVTELTEVTLKRLQYKQMNDMKRRELEKTIYKNADWIDKIKIRLRRFFEKRYAA